VASLHLPVLVTVGLVQGISPVHLLADVSALPVLLWSAQSIQRRWLRATLSSLALTTASGVLVHLTGGLIESHFHFFVVLPLLALYADWRPFGAAVVYVLTHHVWIGMSDPTAVYNHEEAIARPLLWGFIHAGYVAVLCVVMVIHWRLSEDEQDATRMAVRKLEDALDGKGRSDRKRVSRDPHPADRNSRHHQRARG
jgi:hypothetical protein